MGISFKTFRKTQFCGTTSQEPFRGLSEQALPRAIHKPQALAPIEREYRHVNLFHHLAKQRGRLQGAQSLFAQGRAEGIYLEHHLPQRIVALGASSPDRVVPLPQGRQEVRERL